jgi:membrane protein DedA with SNARE-associated domain
VPTGWPVTASHGPGPTVYITRSYRWREDGGPTTVPNGIMDRLTNGGRTGVFLGALVLVLLAFFLPGWLGAILLFAMVATLGWLLAQTWPVTPQPTRAMRLVVLLVFLGAAIYKIGL